MLPREHLQVFGVQSRSTRVCVGVPRRFRVVHGVLLHLRQGASRSPYPSLRAHHAGIMGYLGASIMQVRLVIKIGFMVRIPIQTLSARRMTIHAHVNPFFVSL